MNVQFQHVIGDVTGVTRLAILGAILAGERDPRKLATWADRRIKTAVFAQEEERMKRQKLAHSLNGTLVPIQWLPRLLSLAR